MVLDKTIHIRAPTWRVFEELTRVARTPRWRPGTLRAASGTPGDALRCGSSFALVDVMLGMRFRTEARATAVVPFERFAWRQEQGDYAHQAASYDLAATGGGAGTRLHARVELELPFVLPVLLREDEIRRAVSGREDLALLALKDLCEMSDARSFGRPGSAARPRAVGSAP